MVQELEVKVIRDYPHEDMPADMQGTAKMVLDILFLNSAVDATGTAQTALDFLRLNSRISVCRRFNLFEGWTKLNPNLQVNKSVQRDRHDLLMLTSSRSCFTLVVTSLHGVKDR